MRLKASHFQQTKQITISNEALATTNADNSLQSASTTNHMMNFNHSCIRRALAGQMDHGGYSHELLETQTNYSWRRVYAWE